jgi:hypothetical protein
LGHKICILKLGQPYNICIHNKEKREKNGKEKKKKDIENNIEKIKIYALQNNKRTQENDLT